MSETAEQTYPAGPEPVDHIFGFNENDWREKLYSNEPDKLDKLRKIIVDYRHIDEKAKDILKEYRIQAIPSELMGHIYNLIKMSYDSFDQPIDQEAPLDAITVEQALINAMEAVRSVLETKDEAKECLERIRSGNWIFTPKKERVRKLGIIMDPDGTRYFLENAGPGAVEMLTFFRNRNYELLEKIVLSITDDLPDVSEADKPGYAAIRKNMFFSLFDRYIPRKILKKDWNDILIGDCRRRIAELFGCPENDLSAVVRYAAVFRKRPAHGTGQNPV